MGSKSWFSWHSAVLLFLLVSVVAPALPAPALARADAPPVVLINELDSDTVGTDALEFVELYDGGFGNTALNGLVVVFYNGSNDLSYAAYDLDTYTTNAAGYFTLGNAAVPGVDLVFAGNLLQNGQDAVALYTANGSDFPNNTPVTVANLTDAIVYDTSDADDPGLLVLLNAGQPQVDENSRGASADDSNQRCPNGSGGARNTYTYIQAAPSSDGPNACPVDAAPEVTGVDPAGGATGVAVDANLAVTFSENVDVDAGWFDITCTNSGNHAATAGGGPQSFALDPDLDFSAGEGCTATVYAAAVHDQDTNDPPDIMEADYVWTFETALSLAAPVINEFSASTAGADVEYVEVYGAPSTSYSTYTILEIEGDSGSALGTVDEVISVGTTDAGGFWLQNLAADALENGTLTLLLVESFTGAFGNDLDTNDDGVFDVTPWSAIVDAVAVNDGGTGDLTYGLPVLGPNYDGVSPLAPGGASRYPDGTDTDTTADWIRNDFDLAGIPGYPGTIGPGEAYNTPGAPNTVYVPPPEACGDPFTPIYQVQGSGLTSPLVGTEVALEGIVVGDFQNNGLPDDGDLNGFHVQDPAGDGDPATSDGVFVYYPSGATDVIVGDGVRVRGTVSEYYGLTEVTVSQLWICSNGNSVAPTAVSLPVATVDDFEPYEGMLVTFPQALYLSEYFDFDRYGEIVLTTDRQNQPTAVYEPGSPEQAALAQANLLSRITLDDGRTAQNPDPALHPNGSVFDMSNLFRGGDMVANVTGVLDYGFDLYRIQPVQGADFTPVNLRTPAPDDVGGSLKVASFNLLNYFTTIDTGAPICGPNGNLECRGADTVAEFTRQRNKLIPALATINADVVGLVEIENHPGNIPTADLVSGLNDVMGAGTYAYIATGAIGTDAIRVALIFKPAAVTPVGAHAILDSSVDPRFLDTKNRPVLAQSFQENATGSIFTVAVNHLKSKGSDCNDVGDPDLGDGAGNCNLTRKHAAEALVDWLAGDPTGSGVPDALIVGDLNSYDKEDPIDVLVAGGYTDLESYFHGEYAYSYLFDGQLGYLDYALPNAALLDKVTGATVWHINADEPDLINYDMDFKQDPQDALYAPDAYRSADHDPIIVGLSLCVPVHDVGFDWTPLTPLPGEEVIFNAWAQGTELIDYAWDFGDGDGGGGAVATHTYAAPGTYLVTLTATNDCGYQVVTHELTVVGGDIMVSGPPLHMELCPDTPGGLTIEICNVGNGPLDWWLAEEPEMPWFFADLTSGTLASGACIEVDLAFGQEGLAPGSYSGTLNVNSDDPDTPLIPLPVSLTVLEPAAIVDVTTQADGLQVQFDATATGSEPLTYAWAFGDGATGAEEDPLHTYAAGGCYDVVLTVSNGCGQDTWTGQVCVCDPVHDADFAWDPAAPYVGQEVTFTGTAQGSGPIYYAWAFNTLELGEGLRPSPEGDNPVTHVFAAPGVYLVSMWAWNACGSQLVQHEVTVDPTPPWMHVGFVHLRYVDRGYGKYALRARVQILDPIGSLVPSAMVYVEWTAPNGTVTPQSRSTNAIGEVGFKAQTHQTGLWQICVTDVVKAGWVYDPGSNVEDCEDVTIP